MFDPAPGQPHFPTLEERVLTFWRDRNIYQRSLDQRIECEPFVFYEGPPTANGKPHPGHCLTRAIKDLFPRYKTMRGYHCRRKAGWDTHGLPVEVEVCKELGIHSKAEIEAYGVEPFIHRCQESVWRYMKEWEKLTERIGFWINLDEAYVTYHRSFVESVWWSLKNLFDRSLLYQGHKIVWWWAQGGTALSSGEVGQGYREVADPSVYVRFPLVGPPNGPTLVVSGIEGDIVDLTGASLLVWTTTPWTLPSNQFAAVHPDLVYAVVVDDESGEKLVVADALESTISEKSKRTWTSIARVSGANLIGLRYRPPFDLFTEGSWSEAGPLADGSGDRPLYWRVTAADFVTTDSGTGLVHEAPAFGEVDYQLLLDEQARFAPGQGPSLFCPVGSDGRFESLTGDLADLNGTWVKDADKAIVRQLRENGRLFHQEQYLHEYPFCWRADQDPLIQYPRRSWFIRTTAFRDAMLANNQKINWLPSHIRDGRFGNFLESNVDWALSRERYWGTPLPIWVCDQTGQMEAIGSYEELLAKPGMTGADVWEQAKAANPSLSDDLCVHKPYIDAITYDSPFASGSRMTRVPEVIDCWYDSGAMPFAQWGYPHRNHDTFRTQFPADFISEALDQTRGWFYSQLAISTMLFGEPTSPDSPAELESQARATAGLSEHYPHPFRTCIVLGLMLAEWYESKDGKQRFLTEEDAKAAIEGDVVKKTGKMSKSLRNYRDPQEIFDKYGADALRWYFFSQQPPWNSILYSERAIRESIPEFQLRLWHVYAFFLTYARIDGFDPSEAFAAIPSSSEGDLGGLTPEIIANASGYPRPEERSELDRWLLAELQSTVMTVTEALDRYDNYAACRSLIDFVDGLSNWYIRRSRDRFWSAAGEMSNETAKRDAYWTTWETLVTVSKLIAPMMPFLAETMWRGLVGVFGDRVTESVHLTDWPTSQPDRADESLSARMAVVRQIASLGRSARAEAKIKVRQPLSRVEVILPDVTHVPWLTDHATILREELNVWEVHYHVSATEFVTYQVVPNFRALGPRVGKLMPQVKQALQVADGADLYAQIQNSGKLTLDVAGQSVELTEQEIAVRLTAKEGYAAAQDRSIVVVLATELTDELIREGVANDVIRLIQDRRKEMKLDYTDRIAVTIDTADDGLRSAVAEHEATICRETLAIRISVAVESVPASGPTIGEMPLTLTVSKV